MYWLDAWNCSPLASRGLNSVSNLTHASLAEGYRASHPQLRFANDAIHKRLLLISCFGEGKQMDNTRPNFMVFQKYMETQGTSVSSYISLSIPQE